MPLDKARPLLRADSARSAIIASAIEPDVAPRAWSIARGHAGPRCHAFLVMRGEAVFVDAGAIVRVPKGPAIAWLPSSTRGEFRLAAGGDGAMFSAPEDLLWRVVGESPLAVQLRRLLGAVLIAAAPAVAVNEIAASFSALTRETRDPRAGSSAMTGLHLGLIVLHLWRIGAPPPSGQGHAGASTAQRFRQLVELHYRDNLRVDEFAAMLGVTRAHLHDACLRVNGRPPQALVHERLIDEARMRLTQTRLPVEQVAYGLGFRDAAYFSRFFRRVSGETPGAFRKAAAASPANAPGSFAAWP